ncbi:hypothetical protein WJX73_008295 [Symbiochloris irregularis]|uniref:Uncharacterized protein n=1 Tax=Symbiochloris irregularis TaxID=706552 RepID=A0AAW1NPD3_9CHLO
MVGIDPTGPYPYGNTGTPFARAQRGVQLFQETFGQNPDAVIFGSWFWDTELMRDRLNAAPEGAFDVKAYLNEWGQDLATFMAYVQELLPSSMRILVSTARSRYKDCHTSVEFEGTAHPD